MQQGHIYVTKKSELDAVISLIKKEKIVALDTEFTRRSTYYPVLSLVQVAVKNSEKSKKSFIIDCLSNLDLSDFFTAIADSKIVKILHSSAQDLQIFHQQSNLLPNQISDTQIMANFCGFGFNVGYSNLVENIFAKKLDKGQQNSDWQRRPLHEKQIEYALLDVEFLEELHQVFFKILDEKQRLSWYEEEMDNFIKKTLFIKDETLYKDFNFKHKSEIEITYIKNLAILRDSWAKKINVPRKHLITNEEIEKIAVTKICDLNLNEKILEEIDKILSSEDILYEKEKSFFMNEKQKGCYQEAKKLINNIAEKENFKEQFLIKSDDLRMIICHQDYFDKLLFGWRKDLFGEQLKQIIY